MKETKVYVGRRNGKQREAQKRFQVAVERLGHKYYVCRSVDDVLKIFN